VSSPTAEPTDSTATSPIVTQPPLAANSIHVEGEAKGASAKVKLAAGSYNVGWEVSDGKDTGCYFLLFLTTKRNGPTVARIAEELLPGSSGRAWSTTITVKKAGTYIVEEDESGRTNCHRHWSADLTPK
jgi:hypothetical protein